MTDRSAPLLPVLATLALLLATVLAGCRAAPAVGEAAHAPQAWPSGPPALLAVEGGVHPGDGGSPADVEPLPLRITVGDAVAEALHGNRVVAQARVAMLVSETYEKEARAALLPSITAGGSFRRVDEPSKIASPDLGSSFAIEPRDVMSLDIAASFPIFAFGKYFYAYRAARLAAAQSGAQLDVSESDIAAAVTAAAFDLLAAIRAVDVARSNEEALEQQVRDAQSQLDAGRVTRSDVLEAQVEYDRARRQREKLESFIPIQRMTLNRVLGRPVSMPTEVVDDPVTSAPPWSLEGLQERALVQRPEIRSAQFAYEAAERNLKAVIGGSIAELRGLAGWSTTDSEFSSPRDQASIVLTLDVPVFTGGARFARIRRARHEMELIRLRQLELDDAVRAEVAVAYRQVQETFRDIDVAERSIANSEESLRIQREKFNTGRATSREVLDSTALLNGARYAHVQAIYAYNIALRDLHRALGDDPLVAPLDVDGGPATSDEVVEGA